MNILFAKEAAHLFMKLLFVYSVDDLFKAFSCTILDLNIFCLNTKKSPYLNIFSKYFFYVCLLQETDRLVHNFTAVKSEG